VKKESIVTILNGVPKTEQITKSRKEMLKRGLFIPYHGKIIGCCARLEKVKGQDVLLKAAARLLRENRHLYFVFVGCGSQRRALGELANALGISRNVRFTGYIENAYEYENLFDINVSPSRGTETSCLANSECMALGIPTVASDFGGNGEAVRDGENGLSFISEDFYALEGAISRLLYDKALYEKLSEGAYRMWESDFSLDKMADRYKSFYTEFDKQYYDFKKRRKLLQSNKN
jgi:glycosyltransferase involved in cell wall biosynthesis